MNYPERYQNMAAQMENLGKGLNGTMQHFGGLHMEAIKDGALSSLTKELIALGIAITVRCDGCIAYHVHDALHAGATPAQIRETIGVAILMGGGPSVVYGIEANEALEQFLQPA